MNKDTIMLSKEKIKEGLLKKLRDVSPSTLYVYLVIYAFSDDNRTSSITMQRISELTGLTYPAVQKTISKMIDDGVVKAEKHGNKSFSYII